MVLLVNSLNSLAFRLELRLLSYTHITLTIFVTFISTLGADKIFELDGILIIVRFSLNSKINTLLFLCSCLLEILFCSNRL